MGYGADQVDLGECVLQMASEGVEISRSQCSLTVPYQCITSCGKNQLTLLLFTADPNNAGLSPDDEGEEENNMDRVLFDMLAKAVFQGKGSFNNVLRGSFTVAITHPSLTALSSTRSTIETALAKLEPQQEVGFAVGQEDD